jgi:hypothetical protein
MSKDRFTEIMNYMSAMSREIGQFRAETKARFESLETEMRAGFEQVRSDIRSLRLQLEVVTEDSMELRVIQRDHRKRIEAIEKKVGLADSL